MVSVNGYVPTSLCVNLSQQVSKVSVVKGLLSSAKLVLECHAYTPRQSDPLEYDRFY